MPKITNALALGVVVLVGLLALSYSRASRFERKARDAERFASDQRKANSILNGLLNDALTRVVKRDTVLVHDHKAIAEVDLQNPPPDTCKPNLAARDKTIEDQQAQILDLGTALANARQMTSNSDAARDSLGAALRSRPKALLNLGFIEIGQPKLGVFGGICSTGQACYGAGITVPLRIGGK